MTDGPDADPGRLGVVGTLVWDTIHGRDPSRGGPVEGWGGISYALSAFELAGPAGWELFPIVKVGDDLRTEALRLFRGLDRVGALDGVRFVDAPNNRVELRYRDRGRRTERLRGGVPGWSWEELEPLAASCDALYVNFVAGWEIDLPAARRLRDGVPGPVYGDLHSLFLGVGPDGVRRPRRLEDGPDWVSCFDLAQLNEDELGWLAGEGRDPWRAAARAVGGRTRAVFVTLGPGGARWVPADPDFRGLPLAGGEAGRRPGGDDGEGDSGDAAGRRDGPLAGGVPIGEEPVPEVVEDPDPTGCGDVWGVTCFGALLSGVGLRSAVRRANRVAARNARHRGGEAIARLGGAGAVLRDGEAT